MAPQRNNDVYNHPKKGETNKELFSETKTNKAEQTISINPNPRANENLKDKSYSVNENAENTGAGSEITDGEDG